MTKFRAGDVVKVKLDEADARDLTGGHSTRIRIEQIISIEPSEMSEGFKAAVARGKRKRKHTPMFTEFYR